jgi:hypothetical protein
MNTLLITYYPLLNVIPYEKSYINSKRDILIGEENNIEIVDYSNISEYWYIFINFKNLNYNLFQEIKKLKDIKFNHIDDIHNITEIISNTNSICFVYNNNTVNNNKIKKIFWANDENKKEYECKF